MQSHILSNFKLKTKAVWVDYPQIMKAKIIDSHDYLQDDAYTDEQVLHRLIAKIWALA